MSRATIVWLALFATASASAQESGPPDRFEPNDSLQDATSLGAGVYEGIASGGGADWYRLEAPAGQLVEVIAEFDEYEADLDLALTSSEGEVLDLSAGTSAPERVAVLSTGEPLYVHVYNGDVYTLRVVVAEPSGVVGNDSKAMATPLEPGVYPNLLMEGGEDWYRIEVPAGTRLELVAEFDGSGPDLDLSLLSRDNVELGRSAGVGSSESISIISTGAPVFLRAFNGATYALRVTAREIPALPEEPYDFACGAETWFRVDPSLAGRLLQLEIRDSGRDVDLALHAADQAVLAESTSTSPLELVVVPAGGGFLRVFSADPDPAPTSCGLSLGTLGSPLSAGEHELAPGPRAWYPVPLDSPFQLVTVSAGRGGVERPIRAFDRLGVASAQAPYQGISLPDTRLLVEAEGGTTLTVQFSLLPELPPGEVVEASASTFGYWYRIPSEAGRFVVAEATFEESLGEEALILLVDPDAGVLSRFGGTSELRTEAMVGAQGFLYLCLPNPSSSPVSVRVSEREIVSHEPNDNRAQATPLEVGEHAGIAMGGGEDWYRLDVPAGLLLEVVAEFDPTAGDLDLALEGSPGEVLASSVSTDARERVSVMSTGSPLYLRAYNGSVYTLRVAAVELKNFEPNDDASQATPLEPGLHASIAMGGGQDWYRIEAEDGSRLEIVVEFDSTVADLDLALLASSGEELASSVGTDSSERIVHVSTGEPVFLKAYSGATYDLRLSVQAMEPLSGTRHAFECAGERWFRLGAEFAGRLLQLEIEAAGRDLDLALFDADMNQILAATGTLPEELAVIPTGAVFLRIWSADSAQGPAACAVELIDTGRPLPAGVHDLPAGPRTWHEVALAPFQHVRVTATKGGQAAPMLVFDAASVRGIEGDYDNVSVPNERLLLRVEGGSRLSIAREALPSLQPDEALEVATSPFGHWYRIAAQPGQLLVADVTLVEPSGEEATLFLVDLAGTILARGSGSSELRASCRLNDQKEVYLCVQRPGPAVMQVHYQEIVDYEPNDTQAEATLLEPGDHPNIAMGGEEDWFCLQVPVGQLVQVTANFEHSAGDLDISLQTESGEVLASSAGTDNSEFVVGASSGEPLYLRAYNGSVYSLRIDVLAPPALEAGRGEPASRRAECSGADYYRVPLEVGQYVTVALRDKSDSDVELTLRVAGVDGRPVSSSGGFLNQITWLAPRSGDYLLHVQSSGYVSYTIELTASEPAKGLVSILPTSFKRPARSRRTLLRYRHFQESLALRLKLEGFMLRVDPGHARADVDQRYHPVASRGSASNSEIELQLEVSGDEAVLRTWKGGEPGRSFDLRSEPEWEDSIGRVLSEFGGGSSTKELLVGGDLAKLPHPDLRDGFLERLAGLQALLESEGASPSSLSVDKLVEAALLSALHACYFSRVDELSCLEYFARALALLDLAQRHDDEKVRRLVGSAREDVQILAQRFACGESPRDKGGQHIPPCQRLLDSSHATSLRSLEAQPINDRFDWLLQHEQGLEVGGSSKVWSDYLLPLDPVDRLDALLVWGRSSHAQGVRFGPQLDKLRDSWLAELVDFVKQFGGELGPGALEALESLDARLEVSSWDLLDNVGGVTPSQPIDLLAARALILPDQLHRRLQPGFGRSLFPTLAELLPVVIRRGQEVALLVGDHTSGSRQEGVHALLARYGRHRIQARRQFPELPPLDQRPSAQHSAVEEGLEAVHKRSVLGNPAGALEALRQVLPGLGSRHPFVAGRPGSPRRHTSSVLSVFTRAGKRREGLDWLAKSVGPGPALDRLRLTSLLLEPAPRGAESPVAWAQTGNSQQGFGSTEAAVQEYGAPREGGLRSPDDFVAQQEEALRSENWGEVIRLAAAYPHGAHAGIAARRALAGLFQGGATEDWAEFERALRQAFVQALPCVDFQHHWVAAIDDRFPEDSAWLGIKERLKLAVRARLSGLICDLAGPGSEEELLAAATACRELIAWIEPEPGVSLEPMERGLLADLLELNHQTLARLALTDLQDPRPELAGWIAELLTRTRDAARSAALQGGASSRPTGEPLILLYMVRFGGSPLDVARAWGKLGGETPLVGGELSEITASPSALQVVLESTQWANQSVFLDQVSPLVVEPAAVFRAAYKASEDACALRLALDSALDGSLQLLLHYLPDVAAANAWIDTNAPDHETGQAWRQAFAGRDTATMTRRMRERRGGLESLPRVPSLVEHMNR